jgi:hypothetical protein
MKYIIVALITLIILALIFLIILATVNHFIRTYRYKYANWKVKSKDLPDGRMNMWIERGPSRDLWIEIDADDDSVMYEYDRLLDACNMRNATRKALHL